MSKIKYFNFFKFQIEENPALQLIIKKIIIKEDFFFFELKAHIYLNELKIQLKDIG